MTGGGGLVMVAPDQGLTDCCHHLHWPRPNGVHAAMSQLIVSAPVPLQWSLTGYVYTGGLWTLPPDVVSAPSLPVFKKFLKPNALFQVAFFHSCFYLLPRKCILQKISEMLDTKTFVIIYASQLFKIHKSKEQ